MFEGRLTPHYEGSLLRRIPAVTHHPDKFSASSFFTDTSKSFHAIVLHSQFDKLLFQ